MSAIPIIGPLLAVVKEMGGKFLELKRVEADGRILVATAKAKAEAPTPNPSLTGSGCRLRTPHQAGRTSSGPS